MIARSLNYLRESDDAVRTVAIGGLLSILSVLIIPIFFILGYLVRVLRQTATGNDEPPVFDEWGDLGVDGAKAFVIAFVYSFVPLALLGIIGIFGIGVALLGLGDSAAGGLIGGTVALLLAVVAFAASLAGIYVTPAALSNYVSTDRLAGGFDFGTIWAAISTKPYAIGWLYAFAVILAGAFVVSVFSVVPVIGTILGLFVQFYALVAAYYIVGHTWADVRPVTAERDGVETAERPVV